MKVLRQSTTSLFGSECGSCRTNRFQTKCAGPYVKDEIEFNGMPQTDAETTERRLLTNAII